MRWFDVFVTGCVLLAVLPFGTTAEQTDYDFDANAAVLWDGKPVSQIQFRNLKANYPIDSLPKAISCSQKDSGSSPQCSILHKTHFELVSPKIICSSVDESQCLLETAVALKEDDAILMSQVPSLIFWSKDEKTPNYLKNRLTATCIGNQNSECNPKIQPKSIYCLNSNYGLTVYPNWNCQGKLRSSKFSSYLISNVTISCEGYYSADDSFKRRESCDLGYSWYTFEKVKQETQQKPTPTQPKNTELHKLINIIKTYGIYASVAALCTIVGGLAFWKMRIQPIVPAKKQERG